MSEGPSTQASLLIRLRDHGDERAWAEFTEVYGPAVLQLARRRGLQDADAQDLVQDVFARSPGRFTVMTPIPTGAHSAAGCRGSPST